MINIVIPTAFIAALIVAPVSLALWVALSNRVPYVRLLALLAAICVLGLIAEITNRNLDHGFGLLAVGLMLGGITWVIPHQTYQIIVGMIMLLFLILCVIKVVPSGHADSPRIVVVALSLLTISAIATVYRMCGFRILSLTGKQSDRDLEIGTGKSLDTWLQDLASQDASQLDRTQIVAILRDQGVPFTWQRVLVDAFEMVIGRLMIGQDATGRPQIVSANASAGIRDAMKASYNQYRWSTRQMMFLSFAVAMLAATLNLTGATAPDPMTLLLSAACSLGFGLTGLSTIHAFLKITRTWVDIAIILLVLLLASTIVAWCLKYLSIPVPLMQVAEIAMLLVIFFAIFFSMVAILMRHRGYRLVVIGRGRQPNEIQN